ncbi:hypothetical protein PMAYCL1PPCAC_22954, partial [Pristionchus mayeri]
DCQKKGGSWNMCYRSCPKHKRSTAEGCCPNNAPECIRCKKSAEELKQKKKGIERCYVECLYDGFRRDECLNRCVGKRSIED